MATYTKIAKPLADHVAHLYGALLCEDGAYLLQETGLRINLEWYHTKKTKPVATWTKVT
jgi:hypothetical protein